MRGEGRLANKQCTRLNGSSAQRERELAIAAIYSYVRREKERKKLLKNGFSSCVDEAASA